MSPTVINILLVGAGLAVNATWSIYNARIEKRIAEQVSAVKDWARAEFYDRKLLDERHSDIERRLSAAGA